MLLGLAGGGRRVLLNGLLLLLLLLCWRWWLVVAGWLLLRLLLLVEVGGHVAAFIRLHVIVFPHFRLFLLLQTNPSSLFTEQRPKTTF